MAYELKPEMNGAGGAPDALLVVEGGGVESGEEEAKLDAADTAIAAVQSGDRKAFVSAVEDIFRLCGRKYGGGKS